MTRQAYVQMAVRVPMGLKSQLERVAAEENKHVSELVRELLTEGMKNRRQRTLAKGTSGGVLTD